MAITRTSWQDDDGSGTTGTVINNAEKTLLYDQIDAALGLPTQKSYYSVLASPITGTVHNYNPPLSGHTLIRWAGASDATITGIAGGTAGQLVTIRSVTNPILYLAHYNASSDTVNRFFNVATSGPTPLGNLGSATYLHNGSYWDLIAHDQGAWITPPFSAANFTANGSMTWTVSGAQVTACAYRLSGRTMHFSVQVGGGVVGGTLSNALILSNTLWGGFIVAKTGSIPMTGAESGGGFKGGYVGSFGTASGIPTNQIYLMKDLGANWASGAVSNSGALTFEIT